MFLFRLGCILLVAAINTDFRKTSAEIENKYVTKGSNKLFIDGAVKDIVSQRLQRFKRSKETPLETGASNEHVIEKRQSKPYCQPLSYKQFVDLYYSGRSIKPAKERSQQWRDENFAYFPTEAPPGQAPSCLSKPGVDGTPLSYREYVDLYYSGRSARPRSGDSSGYDSRYLYFSRPWTQVPPSSQESVDGRSARGRSGDRNGRYLWFTRPSTQVPPERPPPPPSRPPPARPLSHNEYADLFYSGRSARPRPSNRNGRYLWFTRPSTQVPPERPPPPPSRPPPARPLSHNEYADLFYSGRSFHGHDDYEDHHEHFSVPRRRMHSDYEYDDEY